MTLRGLRGKQDGILWELRHGVARNTLIGKPKRADHPCDISVTLGAQVLSPPRSFSSPLFNIPAVVPPPLYANIWEIGRAPRSQPQSLPSAIRFLCPASAAKKLHQ